LGKVTQVLVCDGIHLLAVETEWAAVSEQLFEEGFGFGAAAGLGEGLDRPEGRGRKAPSPPGRPSLFR
jgi:hypothetical protein